MPDVDRAALAILQPRTSASAWREYMSGIEKVNNWRSAHRYPLNAFQVYLRKQSQSVDPSALVAQRIKRLSSIEDKLRRYPTMKLTRMQDIGGCRAVVKNIGAVRELAGLYAKSRMNHTPSGGKDYIAKPKASGYRGVHLVYRYSGATKPVYNGLLIEVQIRTKLQHAWATAVETTGAFVGEALKSSQGEDEWLRFFALMASAIAEREGCPGVPGTPPAAEALKSELRSLAIRLDVEKRLRYFTSSLNVDELMAVPEARYFLLRLDVGKMVLTVSPYLAAQLDRAEKAYQDAEQSLSPGTDIVLVEVDSLKQLRKAYPNYFADTNTFLDTMREAID